jgi:hypothetical protein
MMQSYALTFFIVFSVRVCKSIIRIFPPVFCSLCTYGCLSQKFYVLISMWMYSKFVGLLSLCTSFYCRLFGAMVCTQQSLILIVDMCVCRFMMCCCCGRGGMYFEYGVVTLYWFSTGLFCRCSIFWHLSRPLKSLPFLAILFICAVLFMLSDVVCD